jgi:hypothetical protein
MTIMPMGFFDAVWHVLNAFALAAFMGLFATAVEFVRPPKTPGVALRKHRLVCVWAAPFMAQTAAWLFWARDGKMAAYVLIGVATGVAVAVVRGFWK